LVTSPPRREEPAGQQDGLSGFVSSRRRLLFSIVVGLLLAAGVILLLAKASGFAKLVDRLREANAAWLVAATAVQVCSIFGYVVAFRATVAMDPGKRIALAPAGRIVLASLGATRLLAAAGAGGLAVNYWALRRLGIEARDAVIRVLALNTLLYALFGAAGFVAAAVMLATGDAPAAVAIPWLVVVGAAVVAARFVSDGPRAVRLAADPAPRTGAGRLAAIVRRAFSTAVAGVVLTRQVLAAPREHRALLGGCALYWVADIACLGMGLAAFGVDVSPDVVILGYLTGYVANVLPLPTGGVGGVDAAMTFALNALGMPLEDALAGVIAYRFIGFWLPTIPAAWALATLPRLGRTLAATP
jgi:uncharacterized membrane protein YbhN (UPF0104 family)